MLQSADPKSAKVYRFFEKNLPKIGKYSLFFFSTGEEFEQPRTHSDKLFGVYTGEE